MAKALTESTKQGFTLEQTASIADYPEGEIDTIVLPEGVTRLSGRLRNPSVHHIVFPSCIETVVKHGANSHKNGASEKPRV